VDKPRVVEGYVYVVPYLDGDIVVYPEKVVLPNDTKSYIEKLFDIYDDVWLKNKGASLIDILKKLEERRVRVTIEEKKITIEILD